MRRMSRDARWLLGLAVVIVALIVALSGRPVPVSVAQGIYTATPMATNQVTGTATVEASPTGEVTPDVTPTVTETPGIAPGLPETGEATDLPRTITVIGEGRAQVSPDLATANIGVIAVESTVLSATQQVSQTMSDVLAALMDEGVAEDDIQTTSYNINLIDGFGEPIDGEPRQPRYQVSNNVQVTIRDISNIGAIMDAAISAGANQVFGVSFDISNREEVNQMALEEAVQNAMLRAQRLAELTDLDLGPIVSISQVISQQPFFGVVAEVGGGAGGAAPGPISPGQLAVVTQLQITYALQ